MVLHQLLSCRVHNKHSRCIVIFYLHADSTPRYRQLNKLTAEENELELELFFCLTSPNGKATYGPHPFRRLQVSGCKYQNTAAFLLLLVYFVGAQFELTNFELYWPYSLLKGSNISTYITNVNTRKKILPAWSGSWTIFFRRRFLAKAGGKTV